MRIGAGWPDYPPPVRQIAPGDLRSRGQRMCGRHKTNRLGIKYLIIKRQLRGAAADTPTASHLTGKQIVQQRRRTFSSIFQMQRRHFI